MTSSVVLGDIATEIASGVAYGKQNAVFDGVPHLRPFSISPAGNLILETAPLVPVDKMPKNRVGLMSGDILFNNTNSQELVGKSVLIKKSVKAAFSNHMTRIRIDERIAVPGYVNAYLRFLYAKGFFEARATRWVS